VFDHNAVTDAMSIDGTVMPLATWRGRTHADTTSFTATSAQLFAADSLELADGSPAIDKGDATGAPATDFAGVARPQGAAVDIGAYEHCTGSCSGATGSDDSGSNATGGSDDGGSDGSDYVGPPAPGSDGGGGCNAGGVAGLMIALLALPLRRRRR
jgi:hypothetical protein